MYALKTIVQRGALLGAAATLVVATVVPATSVYADALNPLTERSLLLTSSAPGWQNTDGSGNSVDAPNSVGENYAPAGSGPNGMRTGETFTFKVSSTAPVKGFSLQYCTSAAGICQSPGNNGEMIAGYTGAANGPGDFRNGEYDGSNTGRPTNAQAHPQQKSDLDFVGAFAEGTTPGTFEVQKNGTAVTGWTFTKANLESAAHTGTLTGKNNYVTLTNAAGESFTNGDVVKLIFRPSESIYITNPGSKEFFVKINTYNSDTNLIGSHNDTTPTDESDHTVIDGGVTVANVMTDSIHITTKVLETMAFSVGTKNRDTVDIVADYGQNYHGKCDPILQENNNRLQLGNPNAEYSLETGKAWAVNSYWRLSSNSSGGATVYYSGNTLANTVGDEIADMPSEANSTPGTEQFGLGFEDAGLETLDTNGSATWANDVPDRTPSSFPFITHDSQTGAPFDELTQAQTASDDYNEADGTIDDGAGGPGVAKFKFLKSSMTVPERIAQQNEMVVSCATAKMRYVGNIGADTPAGVYTTKINYLAAPQY